MGCSPLCNKIPPVLIDPTPNEEILWKYVASLNQSCAGLTECVPLPMLDQPTECEANMAAWLASLTTLCRKNALCDYRPPILDVPCPSNLTAIQRIAQTPLSASTPGGGGTSGPEAFFVPPPCPTDDFDRADSNDVDTISIPWNERELTANPSGGTAVFRIQSNDLLVTAQVNNGLNPDQAGFMTFGGIGGGPINWHPDQEIDHIVPTNVLFSETGSGIKLVGYGVRVGGTVSMLTGYFVIFTDAAASPWSGSGVYRIQNLDLDAMFGASATVVKIMDFGTLGINPSNTIRLRAEGSTITLEHLTGTETVTDTAIIAGSDGPGYIAATDFASPSFGEALGRFRAVCLRGGPGLPP